jgi:hypothetical protein
VRTQKITDEHGEGLVFQFLPSDEEETVKTAAAQDPDGAREAMAQLYRDALEIYDRARKEVTFERSDGVQVPYVPTPLQADNRQGLCGGRARPGHRPDRSPADARLWAPRGRRATRFYARGARH